MNLFVPPWIKIVSEEVNLDRDWRVYSFKVSVKGLEFWVHHQVWSGFRDDLWLSFYPPTQELFRSRGKLMYKDSFFSVLNYDQDRPPVIDWEDACFKAFAWSVGVRS